MWPLTIAILVISVLLVLLLKFVRVRSLITPRPNDFVVITGCDSGFGLSTATRLCRSFDVIATVLNSESDGAKSLRKLGAVIVPLNYLKAGSITECVSHIRSAIAAKGGRLHGLINNAGVCHFGEFDWMVGELIESTFVVNTMGPVLLIKELMDDIMGDKTRLVNVTSMAAKSKLPFFGLYTSAKVAFDVFTSSLRTELGPHGIRVITIRPGNYIGVTGILDRQKATAEFMWRRMSEKAKSRHADFWATNESLVASQLVSGDNDINQVVDSLENSLLLAQPADEVDVCSTSLKISFFLMNLVPSAHLHDIFIRGLSIGLWWYKRPGIRSQLFATAASASAH